MTTELGRVDWDEIARALLDAVREGVE